MIAEQILFSQGFGTRHECTGLILQGRFHVNGTAVTDPDEDIPTENLTFEVDGVEWPFFEKAIILLNKPEHYECSLKPIHHPSVLSLLPPPLRVRKVQPVGRLDEDTTGLLLLTDDGKLIHRLTHPKNMSPKSIGLHLSIRSPKSKSLISLREYSLQIRRISSKPSAAKKSPNSSLISALRKASIIRSNA